MFRVGLQFIIYLSGCLTSVAVFRKPNAIPLCFSIDLVLNFLLSWLFVHLPSTFFLQLIIRRYYSVYTRTAIAIGHAENNGIV